MDYSNPFATDLIKKFEGYSAKPYWDHKQWSTGFGTRWAPGTPIGSKADHEAALNREAAAVDAWIAQNVKQPLAPNQRAALTSFGYNVGTGRKGASRLLDDINAGNWDRVGQRMLSFNKASGQVNPGLVNRRRQEVETLLGRAMSPNAQPSTYQAQSAIARTQGSSDMAAPIGGAPVAGGPIPLVPPNKRYSKLADLLMAQAAGQKVSGAGDALRALGSTALGVSLADKADTQESDYRSKLAQALSGAQGTEGLAQTMIASGDPDMMTQGVTLRAKAEQAKAEANKPLTGKERFMATPNGVMDVTTQQIVPGTEPKDKANAAGVPSGYRPRADGSGLEHIPGGPADPAVKPPKTQEVSEGAAKAANFHNMMQRSEAEFMKLAPKGQDGKPLTGPDGQPMSPSNPLTAIGQLRENWVPEGIANHFRTPQEQAYQQAAMQWIRAKLRKESGAQISPEEFEGDFKTFFPQPGDNRETLQQKARARAEAMEGMKAESRGASEQMFGQAGAAAAPDQVPQAPTVAPQAPTAAPKGPTSPPPQAVDFLRKQPSPEIIAQFNAKYGPGAAEAILGQQPAQPAPAAEPLPILGSPM